MKLLLYYYCISRQNIKKRNLFYLVSYSSEFTLCKKMNVVEFVPQKSCCYYICMWMIYRYN